MSLKIKRVFTVIIILYILYIIEILYLDSNLSTYIIVICNCIFINGYKINRTLLYIGNKLNSS